MVEILNNWIITIFGFINVKKCIGFNVTDESSAGLMDDLDDYLQEEPYPTIEIIFYFVLGAGLGEEYRPGRCFCSKNHLLPYSSYLL